MTRLAPSSGIPGQQNKPVNQRPVSEIKGGLGPAIADAIINIGFLYEQLDIISGIDAMTVANARPTRGQGKAVTEIAIASTADRLKPIYNGWLKLKEARSRCAAYTIQAIVYAYDKLEDCPYYKILGSGPLAAIQAAGPLPAVDYGFRFEARPTQFEKEEILAAAKAGLAQGKNGVATLTYSEYSFILRYITNGVGKSIKYIEIYMAKKEAEKQAEAHQRSLQTQQLQIDGGVKLKEEERKTTSQKTEDDKKKEIEVVRAKGEELRKTEALKHTNNMELENLKLSAPPPKTEQKPT